MPPRKRTITSKFARFSRILPLDPDIRRCCMRLRVPLALSCAVVVAAVAWFTTAQPKGELKHWEKIGDGVYRTKESPYTYALVNQDRVLLIDATVPPEAVAELGAKKIEGVLLTHHHRDTAAFAAEYRKKGIMVRASQ